MCLIAVNFDKNIEEEKYPNKCGGSVYLDVFENSVWPSYVTSSSYAFSGLGTHTLYSRSLTLNKIWIVWPRHMWWLKKLLPQGLLHFSKEFSLFLPLRISKVRKLVLATISLQGQSGKMLIKLLDDPTCGSKDCNKAYFIFLGSSLPPKISEQILSHSEKRKQRKVSKNLSRLEWIIGSTKTRNVRILLIELCQGLSSLLYRMKQQVIRRAKVDVSIRFFPTHTANFLSRSPFGKVEYHKHTT